MSRTKRQLSCVLVLLLALVACARSNFDATAADGGSPEGDRADSGSVEASVHDSLTVDTHAPDTLASDSGLSRRLSCGSPTVVGSGVVGQGEVTISPDGLSLASQTSNNRHYRCERASLDAPFGPWVDQTDLFFPRADNKQDPAFFEHQGVLRMIVAVRPVVSEPRHLAYCLLDGSECAPITVYNNTTLLDGRIDMDGPSVRDDLRMLISVESGSVLGAIFEATPRDSTLLVWDAQPLISATATHRLDDASTDDTGSLIVATSMLGTNLLYAFRAPSGELGPLQALSPVASDAWDPEVFQRPDGSHEIFFGAEGYVPLAMIHCQ